MYKKILMIGIIILFLGTCINPSIAIDNIKESSIRISGKVIIVDDEGDGDYFTIKEAMNNANQGDIIKVFSGLYNENEIYILEKSITLEGIPYELGSGNDIGKPFISTSTPKADILRLRADDVVLTGFKMENTGGWGCSVVLGYTNGSSITDNEILDGFNGINIGGCRNVISKNILSCQGGIYIDGLNNIVSNNYIDTFSTGIYVGDWDSITRNIIIINNKINSIQNGIQLLGAVNCLITRNIITTTREICISFECCMSNIVFLNEILNSPVGIYLEYSTLNLIKQNNFINNSFHSGFYGRFVNRNRWKNNYWDDWSGNPYKLRGGVELFHFPTPFGPFPIAIPWVQFDWRPAKKPYDIEV